jgi:HSP20 family molecular chaperone IbpA
MWPRAERYAGRIIRASENTAGVILRGRFLDGEAISHYNRDVASKLPQRGGPLQFGDFERAFDELFEDLLITRWRENRRQAQDRALITDRGPHYEVKVPTAAADPNAVAVEVSDWRLIVRFPGSTGEVENTFNFQHPVECDRVSAKWDAGVLLIVLPKKRGRRVEIE